MIISFQGLESFKISQGDLSLAVNPKSKSSADVTLISTSQFASESKGFIINGPGEYEVKDIGVKGFLSEASGGKINTIYMVSFEGLNLAFLGALSNPALSPEALEALEDIDILFVPIGGSSPDGEVLDPATAYKLAVSLESAIIIPTHYDAKTLKQFLKEGGEENNESLDKLVVKKKDLEGKEGDIVVLKEE
jgi:L-ascorbate metabolism protein UlaG (beta-lactamase superfamily)